VLLGKNGIDLWNRANGHGSDVLCRDYERKNVSKETTFEEDVVSKTLIEQYIFDLSSKVCQLIRKEEWIASTVSIKLRYSDFETLTRAKTLPHPTDDDKVVYETAVDLFRKAYTRRVAIRLIGVHLSNLSHFYDQEELFEDEEMLRKRLLKVVTKIRDRYGFGSILVGKGGTR
jgi:DNA polymerase-4